MLGHATFHSLLGRYTLGVFKAAYAFVAKYGDQFAVVWSSVKEEIRHFFGVMPLVYALWVVGRLTPTAQTGGSAGGAQPENRRSQGV